MSNPSHDELKAAIVTLLDAGHGVDMSADLSCYPDGDKFFIVSYIGDEPPEGLKKNQEIEREGEVSEYCETAEEAAELYLGLIREKYEP